MLQPGSTRADDADAANGLADAVRAVAEAAAAAELRYNWGGIGGALLELVLEYTPASQTVLRTARGAAAAAASTGSSIKYGVHRMSYPFPRHPNWLLSSHARAPRVEVPTHHGPPTSRLTPLTRARPWRPLPPHTHSLSHPTPPYTHTHTHHLVLSPHAPSQKGQGKGAAAVCGSHCRRGGRQQARRAYNDYDIIWASFHALLSSPRGTSVFAG